MSAYNFGASGPNLTKLYQGRWLEDWVIKWTIILQGVPPTKFGRARNVRNSARFLTTFEFDRKYLIEYEPGGVPPRGHFLHYLFLKPQCLLSIFYLFCNLATGAFVSYRGQSSSSALLNVIYQLISN